MPSELPILPHTAYYFIPHWLRFIPYGLKAVRLIDFGISKVAASEAQLEKDNLQFDSIFAFVRAELNSSTLVTLSLRFPDRCTLSLILLLPSDFHSVSAFDFS